MKLASVQFEGKRKNLLSVIHLNPSPSFLKIRGYSRLRKSARLESRGPWRGIDLGGIYFQKFWIHGVGLQCL